MNDQNSKGISESIQYEATIFEDIKDDQGTEKSVYLENRECCSFGMKYSQSLMCGKLFFQLENPVIER
jgi:hypothetical protein